MGWIRLAVNWYYLFLKTTYKYERKKKKKCEILKKQQNICINIYQEKKEKKTE